MNFTVKHLPGSLIELTVEVPQEQVERSLRAVYADLASKVKIPGFRKGHVPKNIIDKHFGGQEGVLQMGADKVIQQAYAKIVEEEKLTIVGPVEDVELTSTTPFAFVLKAPVYPTLTIKPYDNISIKKEKVQVKEEEIDGVVEELLDQLSEFTESTDPVKEGHKVEMSFEGFDKAGNAIPNTKSEHHPAVLGKGQFIPGFEEGFMGTTPGNTKEYQVTFPEDYHAKDLAGQEVTFKVTIHKAWKKELPVLDEEMVKKIKGEAMTVASFREEVKAEILKEKEAKEEQRQEDLLMAELMKRTEVELPEVFITQELNQMMSEQQRHIEGQGIDYGTYMKDILKKEESELKESWKERAKERVLGKLIVAELLKKEGIDVTEEETDAKVAEIVQGYPGEESRKKAKEIYRKDGRYYHPLQERLRVEKLVTTLLSRLVK